MYNGRPLRPGILEVYCGPMKSGKSLALIHRVQVLQYPEPQNNFIFIKPSTDTRDKKIASRGHKSEYICSFVDADRPKDMLKIIDKQKHRLVLIDEAQFFSEDIVGVVNYLQRQKKNVVVSGLDLDFRGEPFGYMNTLLAHADEVVKLRGVRCSYSRCREVATRTQRMVNGKPARYTDPIVLVGDAEEGYFPRCLKHHEVPGKPGFAFKK